MNSARVSYSLSQPLSLPAFVSFSAVLKSKPTSIGPPSLAGATGGASAESEGLLTFSASWVCKRDRRRRRLARARGDDCLVVTLRDPQDAREEVRARVALLELELRQHRLHWHRVLPGLGGQEGDPTLEAAWVAGSLLRSPLVRRRGQLRMSDEQILIRGLASSCRSPRAWP